jgi:2-oxoglutarate ferredoxin oxidoreductase subunit beta
VGSSQGAVSLGDTSKSISLQSGIQETQLERRGFSFVEILTMCPTGWFIGAPEGADYMDETLGQVHTMGELKGA